jgi:CRISPR system Cascade subunit CasE
MTNLAQINIDPKRLGNWAGRRGFTNEDTVSHAFVTALFGRKTFQPFRYRELTETSGVLNGYTTATAEELGDMIAMAADPEVTNIISGAPQTRAIYIPKPDQLIGIEVKVVPSVRSGQKRIEKDSFVNDLNLGVSNDRELSYANWMARRLEPASEMRFVRLARHATYTTLRKKNKITVTSAVMQATVCVKDPDAFGALMVNGIGRHKAYGFGMINLTPPHRM